MDELEKIAKEKRESFQDLIDREKLKNIEMQRQHRGKYADRVFWLVVAYLIAVYVFLWFSHKIVSDKVTITVLTTTTVNIIGLFYIIINYFFPKVRSENLEEVE